MNLDTSSITLQAPLAPSPTKPGRPRRVPPPVPPALSKADCDVIALYVLRDATLNTDTNGAIHFAVSDMIRVLKVELTATGAYHPRVVSRTVTAVSDAVSWWRAVPRTDDEAMSRWTYAYAITSDTDAADLLIDLFMLGLERAGVRRVDRERRLDAMWGVRNAILLLCMGGTR